MGELADLRGELGELIRARESAAAPVEANT